MGTIADKISYLNNTKKAIKDSIIENGISIPAGTSFRDYATILDKQNEPVVDLSEGLYAHYTLNNNIDNATRNTVNGNGTEYNGVTYQTYRDGTGYATFDGSDDRIASSQQVIPKEGDFTISFFIYDTSTSSTYKRWITNDTGIFGSGTFCIRENAYGSFEVISGSTSSHIVTSWGNYKNEWQHIAVVVNRSQNQTLTYLNGALQNIMDDTVDIPVPSSISFGGYYSQNNGEYFRGSLGKIKVYDRALNVDEVGSLYQESDEPTLGLTSHYPLTEESRAVDTYSNLDANTIDDAITFRGEGAYFNSGYAAVNEFKMPGTSFTFSCWTNFDAVAVGGNNSYLVDNNGGTRSVIGIGYSGNTNYSVFTRSWRAFNKLAITGRWVHTVFVIDGLSASLYLDGIHIETITLNDYFYFDDNLIIGNTNWIGGYSNIRFYDRVLNQEHITALYNEGFAPRGSTVLPEPPVNGLIAHYPLTGTAEDAQGNGSNESGIEYNGVSYRDESKFAGEKVAKFESLAVSRIDVPNPLDSWDRQWGMSFWFRTSDTINSYPYFLTNKDDFNGPFTRIGLHNPGGEGRLRVYTEVSGGSNWVALSSNTQLHDGEWHHAVISREDTALRIIVDGVVTTGVCGPGALGGYPYLSLGSNDVFDTTSNLNGDLRDFRIYNRTISDNEARSLYQGLEPEEDSPVAHWKFDGSALAYDSINDSYATNTGVVAMHDDVRGSFAYFDNTAKYINIPEITPTSISFWYNPVNASSKTIFMDNLGGNTIQGDNNGTFEIYDGASRNTTFVMPLNVWSHYALVYTGEGYDLYHNGTFITFITSTEISIVRIGRNLSGNSIYGSISDIKFYDRELTADEIFALSNETTLGSLETGLVRHYPLIGVVDEMNNYNGAEQNGLVFDEQYGDDSGLFDGVNDFIVTTTPQQSVMSFSYWAKPQATNNYRGMFGRHIAGPTRGISGMQYQSNGWYFAYGGTGDDWQSSDPIQLKEDVWQHIVCIIDTNRLFVYVDGVLKDYKENLQDFVPSGNIEIGRSYINVDRYYKGGLGEFRIYDKVLSQDEVISLYDKQDLTDGLIANYALSSDWRATDSWVSYDGTEAGGIGYVNDTSFGTVLSNDYTAAKYVSLPKFDLSKRSFTITMWMKLYSDNGRGGFFYRNSASPYSGIALGKGSPSKCYMELKNNNGSGLIMDLPQFINEWAHYALRYDYDTNTLTAFVNGTVYDSVSSGVSVGDAFDNTSWLNPLIANRDNVSGSNGSFSNLRIYAGNVTDQEVEDIYVYENNYRNVPVSGGLIAYYPLKENSKDNNFNQYDGVDSGNPVYDGNSVQLDGNDYILGHNLASSIECISTWVNIGRLDIAHSIYHNGGNGGGVAETILTIDPPNNRIRFQIWSLIAMDVPYTASTNKWVHLTAIRTSTHLKLYVDGVLANSITHSNGLGRSVSSNIQLGAYRLGLAYLTGKLARFRHYNIELTEDEIKLIYNSEKGEFE